VNPFWNLALESYLLEEKRRRDDGGRWLMLWRNEPSIILGRHQNPWIECNIPYLKSKNIHLVRRQSGGGTVYHDLGNTCVSIFSEKHDPERNLQFACDALQESFRLNAYIGPRKDIFLEEFKVSGSAFRITNKACYHHFTLLLSTDLNVLESALKPTEVKLESKATVSVRSRVLNLGSRVSIDHESVSSALASKFASLFPNEPSNNIPIEILDPIEIEAIPEVKTNFLEFSSWPYLYGKTPQFTQRFQHIIGSNHLNLGINVLEGTINEVTIEIQPPDYIVENALHLGLLGHPYHSETLSQTLKGQEAFVHDPDSLEMMTSMRHMLLDSIHG
jgi:lipoate-protein ligase A